MLRLSLRRRSAIAVGFLVLTSAGPRGVVAPQVTAFARPYASFEAIGPEDPGASSCAFAAQPTKGQHTASSSAFPQIDAGLALASTEQGLLSNEYAISYQAGAASYQSPNSAQGYRVAYRTDGIELIARGGKAQWHVGLDLERIGRAEEWLVPLPNPGMRVLGAILVADHETFAIDYVNDARGVRQNFTVRIRPVGSGSLQVRLQVDASLRPVAEGHNTIAFKDQRDSIVVSYTDLHVWDANGDTLPASMVLKDDDIVLIVDDRDADYPIVVDPLLPSGWTVESDQANSDFGACVASAGDVNGDGFSDVIVGARLFDNAQADEGRVFVYHGSANGLSVSANWTAESDQVDAYFGTSVSTAGDVNGDGYSDVIIGAPAYDNGQNGEGRAYIYLGGPGGLAALPAWTAESDQALANYGISVACAGDVNGDGFSEVIVGAISFDNGQSNEGRAFVYNGSATGTSATPTWTAESDQAGASFGQSVACAGDVNADGFSDVIIGAPLFENGQTDEGRVFAFYGSGGGLPAAANWTAESDQSGAQFGYSVSSMGDENSIGHSDIIVGAPMFDDGEIDEGAAFRFYGSAGGLTVSGGYSQSNDAGAQFGWSVACIGDVNGDSEGDYGIGAPLRDAVASNQGTVTYFGTNGPTPALGFTQADANYGRSVASAGDVNGDGLSDVIVGAPMFDNGQTNEGRVFCWLGATSGLFGLTTWSVTASTPSELGLSVSGAGDVNADGLSDLLISEMNLNTVRSYFGGTLPGTLLPGLTLSGPPGSEFGHSVCSAGDVNGDGYSDVIIGAPDYSVGIPLRGRVFVWLGSATGLTGLPWQFSPNIAGARAGYCVAGAGDLNGDGYSDVIIGLPGSTQVLVFHGSASGLGVAPNLIISSQLNSRFGESVAGAGDVNGDGYSDVIVGAGDHDAGQVDEGAVFAYHGSSTGLSSVPAWSAEGNQANASFGSNGTSGPGCRSAGDVNGDGFSDVIIGAPFYDNGQTDEGRAYVYHGSPTGLGTLPSWTAESNQPAALFGVSVGSAGDVNGDGYSDIIVGASLYDAGAANSGSAWVYHGSPTGSSALSQWTSSGSLNYEHGRSVSGAGDVNGDGYSDVIVGAYLTSPQALLYLGNGPVNQRNNMRLYNTNLTTPINVANIIVPQFGAGLYSEPFLGRSRARLVWETRIQGQAFSAAGGTLVRSTQQTSQQVGWNAGAVGGVELKALVNKPGGGVGITATKVRARVRYEPATAITGQVYGPWRYMPGYMDGQGTHNNVPLPVELLYFEAFCHEGNVNLQWATGSERNSGHFIVQRSQDIILWADIGRVEAAGNSQQVITYSFIDMQQPAQPITYYRLLQVDLDGTEKALPMAVVEPCASASSLRVFPNPTDGTLAVDLTQLTASASTLELIDGTGHVHLQARVQASMQRLDLRGLSSGSYVLHALDEQGTVLASQQIVKQ